MATVLVKNLPSVSTTDDDDLLIVNIGGGNEYTTSNIKIGDLRTVLNSSGNSFTSDVEVDGSVTITDVATQSGKTFVGNLVGNVTGQATSVSDISNHSTDTLSEGSNNKYFTDTNFLVEFEKAPIGRLADVTISGNGTATSGKFLLHNGTAFVDTEIATYDQRTEVVELQNKTGIANVDDGDNLYDLIQATATAATDGDNAIKLKMGFDEIASGDNLYDLIQATATAAGDADADIKTKMGYDSIGAGDNLYTLIDATASAATDANTALGLRVTALEADPTTATAVTAVQADVDQNEADADAAIATVQADVDANELTAAAASAAAQDTADKIQTKLAGLTAATYTANDVAELQGIITGLIDQLKTALS